MLRKRVKMLDIEQDSSNRIENIQTMIDKEKEQNAFLMDKIEEATIDKNKACYECFTIKAELDKAKELKS